MTRSSDAAPGGDGTAGSHRAAGTGTTRGAVGTAAAHGAAGGITAPGAGGAPGSESASGAVAAPGIAGAGDTPAAPGGRAVVTVATGQGPARVTLDGLAGAARATLVLGHGAGGGVDGPDLVALTGAAVARGLRVARVEQPWRVAGKRIAPAPARLDAAWYEILGALDGTLSEAPVVLGGRSAGARVACRTAERVGAVAVIALAFPLHPPGRPERSRLDELRGAGVPVFVVQGEHDAFGRPDEFPADVPMRAVPAADHGFAVPKALAAERDRWLAEAADAALTWCDMVVGPPE